MADDTTAGTEAVEVETQATETESAGSEQQKATDVPPEVKRALAKANKEAETLRLKLKEFEDRDKSEAEKLAERAEAAERRASEAENASLRLEVASEKGLTPAQARRLVGSTREELESDADDLLANFATTKADDPTSETVIASLDLGTRGTATAQGNPEADFAKFLGGQLKK